MKNWIKAHKEFIVFLLYAGLTFGLLFFHENWRDEAQAWLIARDCTIPQLINAMKYEGHFLLWYLILMPFAKAGFPYFTTNIISWFITCTAVWLLLRKSPFSFDIKLLLIFTFPLLYLYPVISRCYCLIPLAIVLMSIFYKDRKEKPLWYFLSIVLLLNTHVIMAGMVAVVGIDYLLELYKRWKDLSEQEKQKTIVSIIIAVFLMLISIYPLLGCLTTNKEIQTGGNLSVQISQAVFHYPFELLKGLFYIVVLNDGFYRLFLAITIIVLLFELRNNPLICFKIYLCIVWQCLIYTTIIGSTFQRTSTIAFIVLYYKWVNNYKNENFKNTNKRIQKLCLVTLLLLNIMGGLNFIKHNELSHNFSNAYEMANYINNSVEDNSIILCGSHGEYLSSIIPYIKKDINYYQIPGKRFFSYAIWDNANRTDASSEDIKSIAKIFPDAKNLYYIFFIGKSGYFDRTDNLLINHLLTDNILQKMYCTSNESTNSENYIIFKINQNRYK